MGQAQGGLCPAPGQGRALPQAAIGRVRVCTCLCADRVLAAGHDTERGLSLTPSLRDAPSSSTDPFEFLVQQTAAQPPPPTYTGSPDASVAAARPQGQHPLDFGFDVSAVELFGGGGLGLVRGGNAGKVGVEDCVYVCVGRLEE